MPSAAPPRYIVGGLGQQRLEPVQPALRAIILGKARGVSDLLDCRIERAVNVLVPLKPEVGQPSLDIHSLLPGRPEGSCCRIHYTSKASLELRSNLGDV